MRVGAIELKLLEAITTSSPMSVRQAADTFGQSHGIGLTTVQQMMERLRKKELLRREQIDGTWIYSAVESRESLLKGVVKDFVDRTLGGSLEPFALYLADADNLTPEALERLRKTVDQLSDRLERKDGK